ncbi:MAG: NAD+ synthase [Fluviicoccus sp.]|uniref:NAD+ synthase n=1 Tax=Fluviicoccus sp. TaxID=2003552 RepID=UPI002722EAA8|nr:NAD+ synthase [Fluviicoccus sp.]MDO8331467.1 NAD+ synthase [Fluviicoccus sp.]
MSLSIAIAQQDFWVGDIEGNARKAVELADRARAMGADLIVFPELSLTGYPPEDLLLRPSLELRVNAALELVAGIRGILVVIGYPQRRKGDLYNLAGAWLDGRCLVEYAKQKLPNYQVFDERRYFEPGHESVVFDFKGVRLGLTVCEDIWHAGPMAALKSAGAQLVLNLNASPYHIGKQAERLQVVGDRCRESGLPVVYANLAGGQDELVFDGGSFAMDADGRVAVELPLFAAQLELVRFRLDDLCFETGVRARPQGVESAVYQALTVGVRDYVNKCGFKGVVLGLSGGIDSALVLAIAVDALGPERVQAVMMPFHYTSSMSLEDAAAEAATLGVGYSVLEIAPAVESFQQILQPVFAGLAKDKTEENLQARARGVLLMAISNKKGWLVLTTGNKSEMAVGYATLYGDMAGGFDVLKDVPKTLVFRLAEYRNARDGQEVIPQRVIDRPPSAELAPDQKDEDSLPPYPVLDAILESYIEQDLSAEAIIADGFDRETVYRVIRMVDFNEYKRRQAAIGPRITTRGFGRDRRYPLVNGWRPGH